MSISGSVIFACCFEVWQGVSEMFCFSAVSVRGYRGLGGVFRFLGDSLEFGDRELCYSV